MLKFVYSFLYAIKYLMIFQKMEIERKEKEEEIKRREEARKKRHEEKEKREKGKDGQTPPGTPPKVY